MDVFVGILVRVIGVLLYLELYIAHTEYPLLLVISFDGFRWNYIEETKAVGKQTPNFDFLIENGLTAKWVENVFPTHGYTNHFSIVTGMYAENHGVVGDQFYDPDSSSSFSKSNFGDHRISRFFNNGSGSKDHKVEPIWITNQHGKQQSLARQSGVIFWPGSETDYDGLHPYKFLPYDATVRYVERIDHIVDWFTAEYTPINLGMLYFEEPDLIGHIVGPDDVAIADKIKHLDTVLGYLLQKLRDVGLLEKMNIIITSDHGMVDTSPEKVVELNHYVDPNLYEFSGTSPVWQILPNNGKDKEVFDSLRKADNLQIWYKDDIPPRLHFKHNKRILPIIVMANEGYQLVQNKTQITKRKGEHGYDTRLHSMYPLFIASGPAFKVDYTSEPIKMVDIYPLMCHILGITPLPCDGSLDAVLHLLAMDDDKHLGFNITMITFLMSAVFAATVSGIFCVAACRVYHIHIRRRRVLSVPLHNMLDGNLLDGQTHLLASQSDEELP